MKKIEAKKTEKRKSVAGYIEEKTISILKIEADRLDITTTRLISKIIERYVREHLRK